MNQQDDDMFQQHLAETAVFNERQLKGKCVIISRWNAQLIMIKISNEICHQHSVRDEGPVNIWNYRKAQR